MRSEAAQASRCGFVGVVGAPNVGKSTLLNRLVGAKISIVSARPQTTRQTIRGILTEGAAQAVFIDTPGILTAPDAFNALLVESARRALRDCDLILHVTAPETAGGPDEAEVLQALKRARRPVWLARNKGDLSKAWARASTAAERPTDVVYERTFRVSARTGHGLDALGRAVLESLPPGPWFYAEEDLSDRDLRFLCAELVREKAFAHLRREVPYGLATWTESWEERPNGTVYLEVGIETERPAHKPIIVGAGGSMLGRIGKSARLEIERLLERKVHLELRVRVRPRWRQDPDELKRLGLGGDRG